MGESTSKRMLNSGKIQSWEELGKSFRKVWGRNVKKVRNFPRAREK